MGIELGATSVAGAAAITFESITCLCACFDVWTQSAVQRTIILSRPELEETGSGSGPTCSTRVPTLGRRPSARLGRTARCSAVVAATTHTRSRVAGRYTVGSAGLIVRAVRRSSPPRRPSDTSPAARGLAPAGHGSPRNLHEKYLMRVVMRDKAGKN